MKILFIINSLGAGGSERSLAEMLPAYKDAGIIPVIACFSHRAEGVEAEVQALVPDIHFLTDKNLLGCILAIRKLIVAEKPDLIHTTLFDADVAGRLAAVGSKIPVITSLVNMPYDPARLKDIRVSPIKLWGAKVIDKWTSRYLTHHFHAVTQAVKQAAVKELTLPPERITVVYRGRYPDRMGEWSVERRQQTRLMLGITENEKVLVNVGRQEFQKGQCYLLEAMTHLSQSPHAPMLLIAGRRGVASPELEQLHRQFNLGERVRFLGHRDDIPDILAAADIFVFPSLYEGIGGALIEAMALKLPIITSSLPTLQEVVEEGKNALLVKPADAHELAAAIDTLLHNPEQAKAFGERARQIFEERFTLAHSTERMIALYHHIVSTGRHSS